MTPEEKRFITSCQPANKDIEDLQALWSQMNPISPGRLLKLDNSETWACMYCCGSGTESRGINHNQHCLWTAYYAAVKTVEQLLYRAVCATNGGALPLIKEEPTSESAVGLNVVPGGGWKQ